MPSWNAPANLVVSCARGLAPLAAQELAQLGYAVSDASETMVSVRGTLMDAMRLNLWLRSAHRVLWPLATVRARNLDDLYAAVKRIAWEEWLDPAGYFTVNTAVWNETIRDTRMPSLRAKDAIADRMREVCGRRPDAGPEFTGAAVFVYWREQDLRIYLDTTGEPLSKRGYRKLPGKAPMQETLAAACVLATGWDGTRPFVLPMCGSGTPAIEAALIARRRAPGIFRQRYTFMGLTGFRDTESPEHAPGAAACAPLPETAADSAPVCVAPSRQPLCPSAFWQKLRSEARKGERADDLPPIVATDIDPQAVDIARQNAEAAGVTEDIAFDVCDFAYTQMPIRPGVVFLNPEYGARMGDAATLEPLYARIGDFFKKNCSGWRGFVFTGNLDLSRKIGLRSASRKIFFNGPIECRLVGFDLYDGTRRKDKPAEDATGS
ncbi:MAG: THUMP domain-containing class I SAM-dependent RNA methyltransferase [Kiritimatiellia bacterium]